MAPQRARRRVARGRRRLFCSAGRRRTGVRIDRSMRDIARPGAGSDMRIVEYTPMPPIRTLGATTAAHSALVRWTTVLVWFMRTMAVVWITKGLFAWTVVLGINHAVADFLELPPVMRGMIGFYAVADLMAAVGLWLPAPWGGGALGCCGGSGGPHAN